MTSEISNALKLSAVTIKNVPAVQNAVPTVNESNSVESIAGESASSFNDVSELSKDKAEKPSLALVKQAANHGNDLIQAVNRNLQFKVDDATQEVVVKIVDSDSGKVVRQIPSEEMLAFIKHLEEMQGKSGAVLNDRA